MANLVLSHGRAVLVASLAVVGASWTSASVTSTDRLTAPAPGASQQTPPVPVPIPKPVPATLTVLVDPEACMQPHPTCNGGGPGVPQEGNAIPARLVVQRTGSPTVPPLGPQDLGVATQFAPPNAVPLEVMQCDGCFDARPGDTYAIWVHPGEGNWSAGTYFVLVGVPDNPLTNPELVSIEIPGSGAPPNDCPNNRPPTAVIAGGDITVVGIVQTVVHVVLDGSLSFDPETPIDAYVFTCGNGSGPIPGPVPSKAVCTYIVDSVSRTYVATLQVTDRGTGQIDPQTGRYACQKVSALASVHVSVVPLVTPR